MCVCVMLTCQLFQNYLYLLLVAGLLKSITNIDLGMTRQNPTFLFNTMAYSFLGSEQDMKTSSINTITMPAASAFRVNNVGNPYGRSLLTLLTDFQKHSFYARTVSSSPRPVWRDEMRPLCVLIFGANSCGTST